MLRYCTVILAAFALSGLYRLVTRYLGYRGHTRILWCIALAVPVWALVVYVNVRDFVPEELSQPSEVQR